MSILKHFIPVYLTFVYLFMTGNALAQTRYDINMHYETEYHIWTLRSVTKEDDRTICKWKVTNKADGSYVTLDKQSIITDLHSGQKYSMTGCWGIAITPDSTTIDGESNALMYSEFYPALSSGIESFSIYDENHDGFNRIDLNECRTVSADFLRKENRADSLINLSLSLYSQDNTEKAIALTEQACEIYKKIGNKLDYATALRNLSALAIDSIEMSLSYELQADTIFENYDKWGNDKIMSKRDLFALYEALGDDVQ